MPASHAGAAAPGWRRAAATALLLYLALVGGAVAQQAQDQAPRAGSAARPQAGAASPGMAPLQTEPGDIWAEVRSWTEKRGRTGEPRRRDPAAGEAAAVDGAPRRAERAQTQAIPRRHDPAAAEVAPAPRSRRAGACPSGTPPEDPACAPRPSRRRPAADPPG